MCDFCRTFAMRIVITSIFASDHWRCWFLLFGRDEVRFLITKGLNNSARICCVSFRAFHMTGKNETIEPEWVIGQHSLGLENPYSLMI